MYCSSLRRHYSEGGRFLPCRVDSAAASPGTPGGGGGGGGGDNTVLTILIAFPGRYEPLEGLAVVESVIADGEV